MQYIELKVVNTKLMAMGGGDPAKQMAERTAYLDEIRRKAEEAERAGIANYNENWNPFPKPVRDIIKELAAELGGKARYQDENSLYALRIRGGREDFESFYEKFQERFMAARDADPELLKWSQENIIHPTATAENENDALNELDAHHGGNQALVDAAKKKKAAATA